MPLASDEQLDTIERRANDFSPKRGSKTGRVYEVRAAGSGRQHARTRRRSDALAKRYMDVDSYPFRQPGEQRLIVKIEPEKVNHTP